jgi:hypothetical protein
MLNKLRKKLYCQLKITKGYREFFVDELEDELFRRFPVDVDGDEAGLGSSLDQLIAFYDEFLKSL